MLATETALLYIGLGCFCVGREPLTTTIQDEPYSIGDRIAVYEVGAQKRTIFGTIIHISEGEITLNTGKDSSPEPFTFPRAKYDYRKAIDRPPRG